MLEAVPNVSEGRDARVIAAIGEAFESHATLLDVHADRDHHRSVFTLVADEMEIVDALVAGIARAVELVDLRLHEGVHPRVGVADVVPLVPLEPADMARAVGRARVLAERLGDELDLPVFLYGDAGSDLRPAYFRRGGLVELTRRVEAGELVPDAGPARIDPRSGVALVGARAPLIAYNLVLDTDDLDLARDTAATVRGSSGGLPGLQAIGLRLPETGRVQVSMNVIDLEAAPLHLVVERVRAEATARGVEVAAGELVGLVPERVVRAAEAAGVELPGIDESRILESALRSRLAE
ncbi:MAG TPA: glutamate formimidoyltransferase [Gaiellaceae bacterium]|nr:glutamate formimidoyltransferase [Gaiellaceae bacterium]